MITVGEYRRMKEAADHYVGGVDENSLVVELADARVRLKDYSKRMLELAEMIPGGMTRSIVVSALIDEVERFDEKIGELTERKEMLVNYLKKLKVHIEAKQDPCILEEDHPEDIPGEEV